MQEFPGKEKLDDKFQKPTRDVQAAIQEMIRKMKEQENKYNQNTPESEQMRTRVEEGIRKASASLQDPGMRKLLDVRLSHAGKPSDEEVTRMSMAVNGIQGPIPAEIPLDPEYVSLTEDDNPETDEAPFFRAPFFRGGDKYM